MCWGRKCMMQLLTKWSLMCWQMMSTHRDEVLPQHTKKLSMVVHKNVTETHKKANAHDATTMEVVIKEKAKWMVTYSSTPTLP